ncbi:MAG: flagellar biosynthetic protein FliO [Parachlamydia sp.]|nr:flagellar biosynthetic protein FliO [Parachlamydia sp.]
MKMLCILLFSFCLVSLYAEPTAETVPQTSQQEPPPFPGESMTIVEKQSESTFAMQFMHMLATLGLLIAVVLLSSWVLKRMMQTRVEKVNLTSTIKIVEQRSLTTKTVVSLIEIRGKEFAIAESAAGVTLLGTFAAGREEELPAINRK